MDPQSSALWRQAYLALRPKDQDTIPLNFATKPDELIVEVEKHVAESKGKPIKLPNGENLFVRDVLQKVSRWVKRFVEVGDVAVQYDPGHAALPWAMLRLLLQMSINNIEKHAAVLEGIETISYYLVWSKIEQAYLAIPFEAQAQLELAFVQLYTTILTFTARSLRFLRKSSHRAISAFFSSGSKFRTDLDQLVSHKQSIESYVRQISDQTDQKRYTEILSVQRQLVDLNHPVVRIERMIQSTSATIDRIEQQYILDWVSDIPFQKHFKLAQAKALEGTGAWLFQHPVLISWQACSRSQILWLHGGAGTGKSTLCSMIIQSLITAHKNHQASYPIYFFCSRNTAEPKRTDPEHILRSLMRQALDLPGGPSLHYTLGDRFAKRQVEGDVSADEAVEIIINAIEGRAVMYIIIDALDECDRQRREVLIEALTRMLTGSKSLVKIFVTSRDNHHDITLSMHGFPAMCLDASQNHADIVHYVQYSVQRAITKKKLLPTEHVTADIQQAIVDSLCDGADGMFRWVELQLEFLYTLRMTSILLRRLKQLPPGLEKIYGELYEYNIRELGKEQAEIVKRILSWLLVTKAPLSTQELCGLVCAPDEVGMSIDTVLNMTFDLVRLDIEQNQFRFSHLSVREFLENRFDEFGLELLHSMATCTCLTILIRPGTGEGEHYAARYWLFHAEDTIRNGGGPRIAQQLDAFLDMKNRHFTKWNTTMHDSQQHLRAHDWSPTDHRLRRVLMKPSNSLLIAACFALSTQLHSIISDPKRSINIESTNIRGENALSLASEQGSLECVQVLLDNGANVNAQGGFYGNALQAASAEGFFEVVKLLLDTGANVNAQGGYFGNALQAASREGHIKVVKLLLDTSANTTAQGGTHGTALQAASAGGFIEVITLLLDAGADIKAQDSDGGNALQAASREGHIEAVKLLLDKGANVNAQGGFYGNALQAASQGGYIEVVKLLLDAGANVTVQGGHYSTALRAASSGGHIEVVKLLLDVDADVNAQRGRYGTALQAASRGGYMEVVKLLLDVGADVDVQGGEYGTALQAASSRGHIEVVKLLLDADANVDAQGGQYGTAFQAASAGGYLQVIKLLLDAGANITAQGGHHGNALLAASSGGYIEVVKLLLDTGVDINAQGGRYSNALQAASRGGSVELVKLLLDMGADFSTQGGYYGNALQAASYGGSVKVVKLLLDMGADVSAQGGYYGNALQAAAYRRDVKVVKLLLDMGADASTQGGYYGSALQAALRGGSIEVVELLKESAQKAAR